MPYSVICFFAAWVYQFFPVLEDSDTYSAVLHFIGLRHNFTTILRVDALQGHPYVLLSALVQRWVGRASQGISTVRSCRSDSWTMAAITRPL